MHEKIMKKRIETVREREQQLLSEHGWIVHYVFESADASLNGLANIHTHGVAENFGHPDIQIVLPIAPETIHPVLLGLVQSLKEGKVFEANKRSSEVLRGMDVYFAPYTEGDREVLRLMLPDPKGRLPFEEDCEELYKRQLEELPD